MKALDASQEFFEQVALPSLESAFPQAVGRIAAGLVGNGSECMGFDDELSRDHDWGIEFFLWLTEEDFAAIGEQVVQWKADLLAANPGTPFREVSKYGVTTTVLTPGRFYASLIGFPEGPTTILEWRRVPEENFVLATNGRVFRDPEGQFTRTRDYLLGYYPEDLRLKKIAARCMAIAQTGQYNFLRIAQRGDIVGKNIALDKFVQEVIHMVFLLNRRFMPYYKWAFRAMTELPVLAPQVAPYLEMLYTGQAADGQLDPGNVLLRPVGEDDRNRAIIVEKICALIARELEAQGLAKPSGTFLTQYGEQVQQLVQDPNLKRLPTQYD